MNSNVSPKLVKSCTAVLVVAASIAALSGMARLGLWFWQGEESSVVINKAKALESACGEVSKVDRVSDWGVGKMFIYCKGDGAQFKEARY